MSKELAEIIKREIDSSPRSTIPFVRFMELALYHPVYGYYQKNTPKVGREGDFYTSAAVHPVFAETVADKISQLLRSIESEQPTLVEVGGGTGHLLRHMLERIKEIAPELYAMLRIVSIESSPYHTSLQKQLLGDDPRPKVWYRSLSEAARMEKLEGVIISNEWFDAFPVHIVEKHKHGWREVGVTWDSDKQGFVETFLPDLTAQAAGEVCDLPAGLQPQRIEVNPHVRETMAQISSMLKRGYVITIDYGDVEEELYHPARDKGTLMCYYRHRASQTPLERVGEQDITAHVNFSALMRWGEKHGLRTCVFQRQDEFLVKSGILAKLQNHFDQDPFRSPVMKRNRAIQQLVSPGGMGGVFKVLIQGKEVELAVFALR